ncbi:MAG: hypothetical protein AAFS10_10120, partial [Myxococcota bacterium]
QLDIATATRSNLGEGTHNVSCPANTSPISCGVQKDFETNEDAIYCRLDFDNRRCRFSIDISGGRANNTLYCYCLRRP